jgi:hypothetical protein
MINSEAVKFPSHFPLQRERLSIEKKRSEGSFSALWKFYSLEFS